MNNRLKVLRAERDWSQQDLADRLGVSRQSVNAIEKGGPAEKAGVETGDIILKFNGKNVESSMDLPRIVAATRPGSRAGVQPYWLAHGSHAMPNR